MVHKASALIVLYCIFILTLLVLFIIAVKDLIERDHSSFSKRDTNQNSALMICLKKKKMGFVDMLLASSKTNLNIEDASGNNAAMYALKNDMKDCLKKILARNDLSINHKNKDDQSLLSIAMEKKEFDVIRTILEKPVVDYIITNCN